MKSVNLWFPGSLHDYPHSSRRTRVVISPTQEDWLPAVSSSKRWIRYLYLYLVNNTFYAIRMRDTRECMREFLGCVACPSVARKNSRENYQLTFVKILRLIRRSKYPLFLLHFVSVKILRKSYVRIFKIKLSNKGSFYLKSSSTEKLFLIPRRNKEIFRGIVSMQFLFPSILPFTRTQFMILYNWTFKSEIRDFPNF